MCPLPPAHYKIHKPTKKKEKQANHPNVKKRFVDRPPDALAPEQHRNPAFLKEKPLLPKRAAKVRRVPLSFGDGPRIGNPHNRRTPTISVSRRGAPRPQRQNDCRLGQPGRAYSKAAATGRARLTAKPAKQKQKPVSPVHCVRRFVSMQQRQAAKACQSELDGHGCTRCSSDVDGSSSGAGEKRARKTS